MKSEPNVQLPNDLIMRELTKMSIEQACSMIAEIAREMALVIPDTVTGKEALIALADSIDSTNFKMYGKGQGK